MKKMKPETKAKVIDLGITYGIPLIGRFAKWCQKKWAERKARKAREAQSKRK